MKINSLKIENFRAIDKLFLSNLEETIIIAGPNGSGKSSIFDALRLIKSVYGGYQQNEIDQWFNEFQINVKDLKYESTRLFRNPKRPMSIAIEICLAQEEKDYIRVNKEQLLKSLILNRGSSQFDYFIGGTVATQLRTASKKIDQQIKKEAKDIESLLRQPSTKAELTIEPGGHFKLSENIIFELIFSSYLPENIGIIDFHGSYRNYLRERMGGINLSIESEEQKMSQNALYNYANKYTNIKSEMAAAYIRDLIAREVGQPLADKTLISTLKELFKEFFPGKEFKGPHPTTKGTLDFPVILSTGETHDIDELSSGEKEILYGYLRIRNRTPHNSILLIDEPELHLNPRLIRGLPSFYKRYLGQDLGNQIWLVTHSDAFLREAIGQKGFSVFHMQTVDKNSSIANQLKEVLVADDLEKAIIDLIGDLATYHPGAKIVIFEGGGDSEFDVNMTCKLFPDFEKAINAISGENKQQVKNLHSKLREVADKSRLPFKIFSITDSDAEKLQNKATSEFSWDAYHIENYLLEENYILEVLKDLDFINKKGWDDKAVRSKLLKSAQESIEELVKETLQKWADSTLVQKINIAIENEGSYSDKIYQSVKQSNQEINAVVKNNLTLKKISQKEKAIRGSYFKTLKTDKWRRKLKGRSILRRFVGNNVQGVRYEAFRDLVISKMSRDSYQPIGMKKVVNQILKS